MQTNDIGRRIAERRKTIGISQTDLARALSISPQAVSKWENGLGSPDISLLPEIGKILELSMDQLLGTKPLPEEEVSFEEDGKSYDFPKQYKGLTLVASYGDRACYADIEASEVDKDLVRFADGSEVDLNEGLVINRGGQQIELVYANRLNEEPHYEQNEDQSSTGKKVKGYHIDVSSYCAIDFLPAHDGKFSWKAQGATSFMNNFEVTEDDGIIHFNVKPVSSRNIFNFFTSNNSEGELKIYCPVNTIDLLDVTIRGSSDLNSSIAFKQANVSISGSGDVHLDAVGEASIRIAGAGNVNINRAESAKIDIAGAGDIDIKEINGDHLDVRISGAGDCQVLSGSVQYLKCFISGSGDFRGDKLETIDSEFSLNGFGTAVVGRVLGNSVERVSKGSTLRILQRG